MEWLHPSRRTASEADLDRIGAAFSTAFRIFGDAVYPELRSREERLELNSS
jgi:hypothetical protein